MLSGIDSYFEYVQGRMATINPTRKMMGIMEAHDWPSKQVAMEAFYLLVVGQRPLSKDFWSPAVPVVSHTLQWIWVVIGTDIQPGKVGRNRGDRYRTNMSMKAELLRASYPWFTEKLDWSVQGNSPSGVLLQSTSKTPKETIWWSPLTFTSRVDRESGTVYGMASLYLTDAQPTILS